MPTQPPNTLSSIALTTLDQVKLWIGKADLDASQDDRLRYLINAASRTITTYAQREFVYDTSLGTARTFQVHGSRANAFVDLAPWDAQTITTLQVTNPDGNSALLTTAYYQPGPIQKPRGVYQYIKLSTWQAPFAQVLNRNLAYIATVTGTWGFPSVPEDVEAACIAQVKKWFERDQVTPSPEFDVGGAIPDTGLNLAYDVRMLLQNYRRPVM